MKPIQPPAPTPQRPTLMEVSLPALSANLRSIQARVAPAKIMAVVKANAYGHGLVPCAERFVQAGAHSLGVAFVEEGVELRRAGFSIPILVFGGIFGSQISLYLQHQLDLTASSISKLQAIEATAKSMGKIARVHLKIDTGMERIGVHSYSAQGFLEEASRCQHCEIVGVFSHFACADEVDLSFTKLQLERFLEITHFFRKRSMPMPLRHIANSAAVLQLPEAALDMVRPGIALYGVYPSAHLASAAASLSLIPAMRLKSRVVYFKVVKKGAGVSYGHTWHAPEDTRVVTIPVGYGDGYFRHLSNKGKVLIRGKEYPIIGNVCMDQIMVNLGAQGEAYNADEVILLGSQGERRITVNQIADLVGTIPYEVLTATNMRVPRVYVE